MTTSSTLFDGGKAGTVPNVSDAGIGAHSWEFSLDVHPFGRMPVRVDIDEDGTFLAVELVTSAYGVATTFVGALAELMGAIHRHYEFLRREGRDRLSPRLYRQLEILEARRAPGASVGTPDATPGNRQIALAA